MAEQPAGQEVGKSRSKRRRLQVGVVVSDKGDKSIRVRVARLIRHRRYEKYIRRRTILHAHDERNEAVVGERVEIMECRPYSKLKSWRLVRVLGRTRGVGSGTG